MLTQNFSEWKVGNRARDIQQQDLRGANGEKRREKNTLFNIHFYDNMLKANKHEEHLQCGGIAFRWWVQMLERRSKAGHDDDKC